MKQPQFWTTFDAIVGALVLAERQRRVWNQSQFAGVSQTQCSRVENGASCKLSTLAAIFSNYPGRAAFIVRRAMYLAQALPARGIEVMQFRARRRPPGVKLSGKTLLPWLRGPL